MQSWINLNCNLISDYSMDKTLKKTLVYVNLFGSIATTLLVLKYTNSCNCLNSLVFCDISSQDFATEDSRWLIVRSVVAKISLFLFAHALFVMLIRIFTKKSNPATEQDPEIIKVLNRIITNTIEQSIIFLGLYVYFLFEKAGDRFTSQQLLVFASWFLIARLVFSITYILGLLIGVQNFRAFGFALNFATNVLLIELCFCPSSILASYFFGK